MMDMDNSFMIWTIVDSGFPTGSFAHSLGVEAAASLDYVQTKEGPLHYHNAARNAGHEYIELQDYIEAVVENLGSLELPFVVQAHQEPVDWKEFDHQFAVRLYSNQVAFKASATQGLAFLRICTTSGLSQEQYQSQLEEMRRSIYAKESYGLLPIVFGAVCSMLGISSKETQKMYLFLAVRDMISAAKRLGLTGPNSGVALQASIVTNQIQKYVDKYISESDATIKPSHQTFPLGDIIQGTHSSLFRKLFIS